AIFWARFIFGMRIIAGPLAGVLSMPWRKFLLFNFLGAVVWVSAVATIGYVFGREFERVLSTFEHVNLIVFGLLLIALAVAYFRFKKQQ
ncbi:MAG TPA: LPXTG cell wall anchor domain-containing protein, partial [Terriglobales bacterium]|nr:LPXTG cell wall anchor domain-containing protein [Terriglobales bacterium]